MVMHVFDDMSGLVATESIRPRMDPEVVASLLQNDDLQQLLKEDTSFQDLICAVVRMNKADRAYFQNDHLNKVKGMCVLDASAEAVDCRFLQLHENPFLCEQ
jgi:hypothetical protein